MALQDSVKNFLQVFGSNRQIQSVIVVLLSFVAAKIANWTVTRAFARLTNRTGTPIDNQILNMLRGPVFNSVLLAGLAIALAILQPPEPFGRWGLALVKTIAVLVWLVLGIQLSTFILGWMAHGQKRFNIVQTATLPLFDNAAKIMLVGAASYFILLSWHVDVTGWLASAGVIGLALGFAARDTLANLFAGVSIIADAPYKVGDFIVLSSGERGQVTQIGIRSTRILTRDDAEITVPNSTIANSMVVNESGGPWVKQRIRIRVSVAYGSDIDVVRQVLLDVSHEALDICAEPQPRVRFREFGDSGLIFELLCWIEHPILRGQVVDTLNTAIYKAFARAGVEIPYPKRDVYIKGMPGAVIEEDVKFRG